MTEQGCKNEINAEISSFGSLSPELYVYAERLQKELKPKRFRHSLGVARLAAQLAERWGEDVKKAELAGLLHDVAKNMDYTELYDFCRRHDIETGEIPSVLHAPAGAALLREAWGITDAAVLSAVASHTVATKAMSELERIVYLADVAESSRSYEGVETVRKLIFEDLDKAMLYHLEQSLADLERQGKYIAPESLEALAYYRSKDGRKA